MAALLTRSRAQLPCTCHSLSRSFATLGPSRPLAAAFNRPAPPALPPQQQREFEELIRRQNAPASAPIPGTADLAQPEQGELELHPDYRAKPKPQFEGSKNPETGEVGGPKNEPLQHGDWSYGGKVTDF
ncbi:hypothetical protein JCM11491_000815 [Sporobolomyces phaffii]